MTSWNVSIHLRPQILDIKSTDSSQRNRYVQFVIFFFHNSNHLIFFEVNFYMHFILGTADICVPTMRNCTVFLQYMPSLPTKATTD